MNNTWLLLGPEHGLKQQELAKITTQVRAQVQDGEELEKIRFYVGDSDAFTIASEIQTPSLFASYRLIEIFQVDLWNASDTKTIADALKSKDEFTYVVMLADATKMGATIDKLVDKQAKKVFWQLTSQDYSSYIMKKSQSLDLKIHQDAVDLIIYIGGDSTLELDNILEQIAVFQKTQQGDARTEDKSIHDYIMKEDIEIWLSHFKQETIFKLFEDMSNRHYEKAFLTLEYLLRGGENPSQLMAGLVYQVKNSLRLAQGMNQGHAQKSVFITLNIRSYVAQQQYQNFIQYCDEKALERMLQLCLSTEEKLRSGGDARFQRLLMSTMLYHLCMLHSKKSYVPYTGKSKSNYNISNIYLYDW